jgi:hypothetical protein
MSTLETQYQNYLQKNPNSSFTFEEWKTWFGKMLVQGLNEMYMKQSRESIIKKINNQTEFELDKNELTYIIENWISTQSQHRMNFVKLPDNVVANVSINKDSIFKH